MFEKKLESKCCKYSNEKENFITVSFALEKYCSGKVTAAIICGSAPIITHKTKEITFLTPGKVFLNNSMAVMTANRKKISLADWQVFVANPIESPNGTKYLIR